MKNFRIRFALKQFTGRLALAIISLTLMVSPACSQEGPPSSQTVSQNLSSENLQDLLAPIALYPDALIALILPASTVPSDVVLASRFVANNGDPQQIPNQTWDDSVQSLASYPEVITWMDQNLEWTSSVGQAFIVQPADVMNAIQQLRVQADTAGNLVTTPQQVIVREKTIIRIVPAEPEYLYVPRYDPEIVYVQPYSQDYGPLITFGLGFAVGSWLNYDFDWNRHEIYRGDWQPGWDYGRYGNNGNGDYNSANNAVNNVVNVVNINQNTAEVWQPSSRSRKQVQRQQQNFNRAASNIAANAETTSDGTAATVKQMRRDRQDVPKPTRADFGKRGAGKRNAAVAAKNPGSVTSQTGAKTATGRDPTSPPDVAGQKGKASRKADKAKSPNGKKSDRKAGPQALANSTPNQTGGDVATVPSKKEKRAAKATSSEQLPRTTRAPAVDKKGRTQPEAAPSALVEKRSKTGSKNSPAMVPQVSRVPDPVSPLPEKKQTHKNATSKPKSSAPTKLQKTQQKKSQSPTQPKTERKQQKSVPEQKFQPQKTKQPLAPQQIPQKQKQKPQQQRQEKPQKPKEPKQSQQQQKPSSKEKKREKESVSAPSQAAQPEKAPDEEKSDKKKKGKKN